MLNLIDNLSTGSEYVEATVNDPDLAERVASGEVVLAEPTDSGPRFSEWGLTNSQLAQIIDALSHVAASVMAAAGVKPDKPRLAPRPVTALQRASETARERKTRDRIRHLSSQLLPDDDLEG